ncbi:aldehyde dehydrogenase family protein [Shigella sonnei]
MTITPATHAISINPATGEQLSVLPWAGANDIENCASDARVAFGGVKKSGFGRELSHFGLHEFCNIQTVWKDRI